MNNDNYYVVLDDGDTFSSEDGSFVCILTDEGHDELDESGGMKHVSSHNMKKVVLISDLIDCWIKNNGSL